MNRKSIKKLSFIFILGLLLGIGAMTYASAAWGSYGYYGPILGYYYDNQAYVSNDPGYAFAGTYVEEEDHVNVPVGYMGAQAVLYKNGAIYTYCTMKYNSTLAAGMSASSSGTSSSGTYYSKGITAAYNGNGYSNYYTFQSPSINQ